MGGARKEKLDALLVSRIHSKAYVHARIYVCLCVRACLCVCCDQVSGSSGCSQTSYIAEDGLELLLLLTQPLECQDFRHVPPCPAQTLLRTESRAVGKLDKHSTMEATAPDTFTSFSYVQQHRLARYCFETHTGHRSHIKVPIRQFQKNYKYIQENKTISQRDQARKRYVSYFRKREK